MFQSWEWKSKPCICGGVCCILVCITFLVRKKNLKTLFYWYFQNFCVINLYFFWRVNEYKQEGENAELSKTAGELLENAEDPKFANSKVIMDY